MAAHAYLKDLKSALKLCHTLVPFSCDKPGANFMIYLLLLKSKANVKMDVDRRIDGRTESWNPVSRPSEAGMASSDNLQVCPEITTRPGKECLSVGNNGIEN